MTNGMNMFRARRRAATVATVLATTIALGCGTRAQRVVAHYESPADHLEWMPPCTPEHPLPQTDLCRGTGHSTTPTRVTGDWQGNTEYVYGWLALPSGVTFTDNLETFTGTVAGCGSGRMTYWMHAREDEHGNLSAQWSIVDGFGTGELTDVRGHGTLTGVFRENDLTSSGEFRGWIRCRSW
jgi:hypothetical protein